MYASIRRYKKISAPQVNRSVKEGFLPVISRLPGFVSYYAIDTGNDDWVTVTVFDSRERAEQSNHLAADFIQKNLTSFIHNDPEIIVGEVVAQRSKGAPQVAAAGVA